MSRRILGRGTLNALTTTGQVVHCGAYAAARLRAEQAAEPMSPERRARYLREAIQWQEDAATLSARQRECYAEDNLVGGAA